MYKPEYGLMRPKHVRVLTTREINQIYLEGDLHPTLTFIKSDTYELWQTRRNIVIWVEIGLIKTDTLLHVFLVVWFPEHTPRFPTFFIFKIRLNELSFHPNL
jgi:hypothetical protein